MLLFKYIDRINLMDKLIQQRRTGTQKELAARLQLSVSRLACIIEYLKTVGAPIAFNRSTKTYYYRSEYSIQIKVKIHRSSNAPVNSTRIGNLPADPIFRLSNCYSNIF